MSKIRKYCAAVGFMVAGKLRYMGKWDHRSRFYMDDAGTVYLIDTMLGNIQIKQPRRK